MAARQRFEHYATRVNLFVVAAIILWQILHGRGLIQVFYLVLIVRGALNGFDFPREAAWWIALVFCVAGVAGLAWGLDHGGRGFNREDRLLDTVLLASLGAQAGLLVAGRLRRTWGFCRRRS